MKTLVLSILSLLLFNVTLAKEAQVTTFKHTLRWLDESGFPNYFVDPTTRSLIWSDISSELKKQLEVEHVILPERADYKIITGFGKPKNKPSAGVQGKDFSVDVYSFLTRATTGLAVFWSVEVVVKDQGRVVQKGTAKCEIENANAAAYLESIRWMTPVDFRKIFTALFCEALGTGEPVGEKVVVGSIEEKEKEVRSWFPNSTRHWLKMNGAMHSGENFSAQLTTEQDTLLEMSYRVKEPFFVPISGKQMLAQMFTDLTDVITEYTFERQGITSGLLEFSDGKRIKIQLEWIAEFTGSTNSDELITRIAVPLIGQFMTEGQASGEFVYETITEVLDSDETTEKFSVFAGSYKQNSYGTSVLHRVKGVWNGIEFRAEYNELFGISEIRINNEILASMIFQNCNPENLRAYNNAKISKNKKNTVSSSSDVFKPKLDKTEKQEWYPLLIKNDASQKELEQSCALLACLFFAMARM